VSSPCVFGLARVVCILLQCESFERQKMNFLHFETNAEFILVATHQFTSTESIEMAISQDKTGVE